ncbi:MAG: hypothetical protein ACR2QS_12735 [Woeseiaceae bacterium]
MSPATAKSTLLLLVLPCSYPSLAQSQEDATDVSGWGFNLGAFFADQDMKTQFQGSLGDTDVIIDFEDDLGLRESQSVFRLAAFYDFNERHRVDLDVFDLSQNAVVTLSREIEWDGSIFPISAEVSTGLDLTIYKAAYTYNFLRRDNYKLGFTGGLYIADIALKLNQLDADLVERGAVTAPLPVLGLRGEYFLSDRWRASASAEWFGVQVNEYEGTLHDFMVGIDYRFGNHAAVGLGYNNVEIDVDATEEDLRADLMWQYSGFFGYLRFTF